MELVELAEQVELVERAELVELMETIDWDIRMFLQALFEPFTQLCLRFCFQQLKHTVALCSGARDSTMFCAVAQNYLRSATNCL